MIAIEFSNSKNFIDTAIRFHIFPTTVMRRSDSTFSVTFIVR